MDKIFVDNLKVECIVGILPFEREKTQPLFVSLVLETPLEEAGRTGALEKVLIMHFCLKGKSIYCKAKGWSFGRISC